MDETTTKEAGRQWEAFHDAHMERIQSADTVEAAALAWYQYWHDTSGRADPYDEYAADQELYERIKALRA